MNYSELAEALRNVKITFNPQIISQRKQQINGELAKIKKYTGKYSVANHSKRYVMEFSNATYELYNLLIEKLSEILPHDEDNGKLFDKGEFYLTADSARNELIKITIQKTNGVSVNKNWPSGPSSFRRRKSGRRRPSRSPLPSSSFRSASAARKESPDGGNRPEPPRPRCRRRFLYIP